jgi:MIP family channel proteins
LTQLDQRLLIRDAPDLPVGTAQAPPLLQAVAGELLGTFLLVLFGTGSVASAVLTGSLQGLWQVAVVWGFGVALAIHCSASLSGAHLNPAVTLAVAVFRRDQFPARHIVPYWVAQLAGATGAGLVVLAVFNPFIARFETREGLIRGAAGSERAAMIFGQYFPNPAMFGAGPDARALVGPIEAALVEALGTAILVLVIFALTDPRNGVAPGRGMIPFFIGFTVAILICLFAPVTQAGWNPARDLGPRLVAWLAGYGEIAIPGPGGGFWVYLAGPLVGGLAGAGVYDFGFGRLLDRHNAPESNPA